MYLLQAIIDFLGIGTIKPNFNIKDPVEIESIRSTAKVVVRQTGQVIDFVNRNPMLTRKCLDFESWKLLYQLRKNGEHLTTDGIAKIQAIRAQMNSKRV